MTTSHTTNIIDAAGFSQSGTLISASALQINQAANIGIRNTAITTATAVMTVAANNAQVILLDRAAGITVTLPAASGSGAMFTFIVKTTASGGSYIIKVANSSDVMTGTAVLGSDTAAGALLFNTLAASDTITMNGVGTGGTAGARVVIRDVATNLFYVDVVTNASGTEATPFSATV